MQLAIRDSLDAVEKEKKMMELEAVYNNQNLNSNLKSKEKELSKSENNSKQKSKKLTLAFLIIIFVIITTIVFFYRYKSKKKLSQKLYTENNQNLSNIHNLKTTIDKKNIEINTLKTNKKLDYPSNIEKLTKREKDVLIGLQEGLKDKEIADKLFISITTVRTHLRKAFAKIDVRNRVEAIQFISKYKI